MQEVFFDRQTLSRSCRIVVAFNILPPLLLYILQTLLPNLRKLDLSHNFLTDVQYLEVRIEKYLNQLFI